MGDLKFSTVRPTNIKLGSIQVSKIMMGSTQVWPSGEPISFFLVGGGGGGGYNQGGGGGGGEIIYVSDLPTPTGTYSVIVGNGGNGGTSTLFTEIGQNGFDSSIFTYTAIGGGGGGSNSGGISGGSGGGGGNGNNLGGLALNPSTGNDGGRGYGIPSLYFNSGGGGGGDAVGNDGSGQYAGSGGAGQYFQIFSSPYPGTYYCGGGGGGTQYASTYRGIGGTGGGGAGGSSTTSPIAGTANLGGGGGGGKLNGNGANGGSGVVLVRYLTDDFGNCTGGVKTTLGSYTIHTFNSSGSLVLSPPADITAPTAPTNVVATASGTYSNMTWTASYDLVGVTNYLIYQSSTLGGVYTLGTTLGNVLNISYGPLVNGTYYFKMTAKDAAGNESVMSVASNGITINTSVPVLQTDLNQGNPNPEIDISWTNASASNKVYRSTNGGASWALRTTTANSFYNDTIVIDGSTYWYKVSADGDINYSNIVVETCGIIQ